MTAEEIALIPNSRMTGVTSSGEIHLSGLACPGRARKKEDCCPVCDYRTQLYRIFANEKWGSILKLPHLFSVPGLLCVLRILVRR